MRPHNTVAIIGAGSVGGTIAYGLVMRSVAQEILLVDMSLGILQGQAVDLSEAAIDTGVTVRAATFHEAGRCDVIIITADTPQQEFEERQRWIHRSKKLLHSIVHAMSPIQPKALIILTAEPMDALVRYLNDLTSLPSHHICGVGTCLSGLRLKAHLAHLSNVSSEHISAHVLGSLQHPVVAWHSATIDGKPAVDYGIINEQKETLYRVSHNDRTAWINGRKGGAWFGVSTVVTNLVKSALTSSGSTFVLSTYVDQFRGCLSVPVIVSTEGFQKQNKVELSREEIQELHSVASTNNKEYQE
ncbi:uncharacterized protein BYT42DRAFT_542973 [Radiomyces spectabilis]|uniref:uncharacterized protein n=1 Tax=Radiomyces spectabilis TaxID=64574 RepID=UPI00221FC997|nr:uncharacterized protein BYT42DRAFT_542973 [Radiomyces spectabilis]KAI8391418.1 hypothetical protein BYT42DRAFT_542973 [Radiomyces spectabilis]